MAEGGVSQGCRRERAGGVTDETLPNRQPSGPRAGRLALVVGVGLLIWALPRPDAVDPRAWRLLAIFVATVVGIVAEPVPMGAMSLMGIAAALATRTLTIDEALSGFANRTVWLVVTAFFIATGLIKTGLGARLAYGLVAVFGRSTLGVAYSLVSADLMLAPAIPSNTARAGGVIFPILLSLSRAAPRLGPGSQKANGCVSDADGVQRHGHHERDVPDRHGGKSALGAAGGESGNRDHVEHVGARRRRARRGQPDCRSHGDLSSLSAGEREDARGARRREGGARRARTDQAERAADGGDLDRPASTR